jgi:hypothetical protein
MLQCIHCVVSPKGGAFFMAHRLSPRQEAFCIEYIRNGGNAAAAAEKAGYAHAKNIAHRLLENVGIQGQLMELGKDAAARTAGAILEAQQVQLMWCEMAKDATLPPAVRLRALELHAKSLSMFVQKVEHTGAVNLQHWLFSPANPFNATPATPEPETAP